MALVIPTPPESQSRVRDGEVVGGKYRVVRVIGEGGMGVVLLARHIRLDTQVAIKVLSARAKETTEVIERFAREAKAAAKIQSEHVGKVLDVDVLSDGTPFIVMEYLEGNDLADELDRTGPFEVERAVTTILEACDAIAEAHASGIVHRDLKPANLFLARNVSGQISVKVLDFGISKFIHATEGAAITANKALTNPATMLGSPLYMSPEQMKASSDVDARSDLWSLGVILYELLSGRSPFDAKTVPMICAAVLGQMPAPIEGATIPVGLQRVVFRCLEKDPHKRYRDVAHLVRALSPFAPELAQEILDRVSRLRDVSGQTFAGAKSIPPGLREGARTDTTWDGKSEVLPRRRLWPAAILFAICSVLIGVFVLYRRHLTAPQSIESFVGATSDTAPNDTDALALCERASTLAGTEDPLCAGAPTESATPTSATAAPEVPIDPPATASPSASTEPTSMEAPPKEVSTGSPSHPIRTATAPALSGKSDGTAVPPPPQPQPPPKKSAGGKTDRTRDFGGRE